MTNVLSHAEIVIVGTGPSGMSAAAALCSKGKGILVIDKAKPIPNSYHLADLEMQKKVESGQHLSYLEKILRSRLVKGTPKKFHSNGITLPQDATGEYNLEAPELGPGGLSLLWGANIFPFTESDLSGWPFNLKDILPFYEEVLKLIPCSYDRANIEPFYFPQFKSSSKIFSKQGETILAQLQRERIKLEHQRFSFGASPISVWDEKNHKKCMRCQLCLSGCPYGLIFSSSDWFSECKSERLKVEFDSTLIEIKENGSDYDLKIINSAGAQRIVRTQKVLLGAGPIETAKILLRSFPSLVHAEVTIKDSCYFILPIFFFNSSGASDLIESQSLSQLFIRQEETGVPEETIHTLLYGYSPLIKSALPRFFSLFPGMRDKLLARLGVLQGYLHSDLSGVLRVIKNPAGDFSIFREVNPRSTEKVRRFVKSLVLNRKEMGFAPIQSRLKIPPVGSGFHFGSSFPMSSPESEGMVDLNGRIKETHGVYLIDSSILPSMPATNPTLTIMANAYRIASQMG